jgi:hypothetical protein
MCPGNNLLAQELIYDIVTVWLSRNLLQLRSRYTTTKAAGKPQESTTVSSQRARPSTNYGQIFARQLRCILMCLLSALEDLYKAVLTLLLLYLSLGG